MPRDYNPKAADRSLFSALIDARDKYGAGKLILEDQERRPLSYTDVIRASSEPQARIHWNGCRSLSTLIAKPWVVT